jgi:hypothetical protein
MNNVIKRLTLPSPKFFVAIQNVGMGLTAFAIGIKAIAVEFEGSRIIDFLLPFTTDIAVAGAMAALIAKLTVKLEIPNRELNGQK